MLTVAAPQTENCKTNAVLRIDSLASTVLSDSHSIIQVTSPAFRRAGSCAFGGQQAGMSLPLTKQLRF